MLVFISWSGDSSKQVAESLRDWLRLVVQACRPWMSEQDIDAGAFWDEQVRARLLEAKFGVVCVTAENLSAPWLNYEAGALAERLAGSVCPYLFGVRKNELAAAPLSRLQAQHSDRDGTFGLVAAINKKLGEDGIPDGMLLESFETFWPRLRDRLGTIATHDRPPRPQAEKIDELLSLMQTHTSFLQKLASRATTDQLVSEPTSSWVEPRIQMLLQKRLSEIPEYDGWSVGVTRFGSVFQARFARLDGSRVLEGKLRLDNKTDPVEALKDLFVTVMRSGIEESR